MASHKTAHRRRRVHSSKRRKNVKSRKVMRGGCNNSGLTSTQLDPTCWTEKDGILKVKPQYNNFGFDGTHLTPAQRQNIRLKLNPSDRQTEGSTSGDPFANFNFGFGGGKSSSRRKNVKSRKAMKGGALPLTMAQKANINKCNASYSKLQDYDAKENWEKKYGVYYDPRSTCTELVVNKNRTDFF